MYSKENDYNVNGAIQSALAKGWESMPQREIEQSLELKRPVQGHSVDKKMAKPHEQLFFLKFRKMTTFLRLNFLKK